MILFRLGITAQGFVELTRDEIKQLVEQTYPVTDHIRMRGETCALHSQLKQKVSTSGPLSNNQSLPYASNNQMSHLNKPVMSHPVSHQQTHQRMMSSGIPNVNVHHNNNVTTPVTPQMLDTVPYPNNVILHDPLVNVLTSTEFMTREDNFTNLRGVNTLKPQVESTGMV